MTPETLPVLAAEDRTSLTWLKLKKHFEERLAELRRRNDSANLDAVGTARLRGEIAAIKYSLALGENPLAPAPEADEG